MALVNTHPDYLKENNTRKIYHDFLLAMKNEKQAWCALPSEVARWWKARSTISVSGNANASHYGKVSLDDKGHLTFT